MKLSTDGNWLDGDYYTGRDRTNFGRMHLRLVSSKRLDLQEAKKEYLWLEKEVA